MKQAKEQKIKVFRHAFEIKTLPLLAHQVRRIHDQCMAEHRQVMNSDLYCVQLLPFYLFYEL